jgi:hypothetical protein
MIHGEIFLRSLLSLQDGLDLAKKSFHASVPLIIYTPNNVKTVTKFLGALDMVKEFRRFKL